MANQFIYSLTDTWSSGTTVYTSIKMNVTDAASALESLLLDLQIGGASKIKVSKAGNLTITNTDAGVTAGPNLTLFRDSVSPAASDIIGSLLLQGRDSLGNIEDYAEFSATITDTTSASEDANLLMKMKIAGAMTTVATFGTAGATIPGLIIGTNVQAYDAELAALAANATAGLWTHTGAGTGAARTLTGTAAELTVTDGNGVAGNPTLSFPAALTFTGKTITGGTFASGAFNGTVGATTPSTGAFTTASFTGPLALPSGGVINFNVGGVTITHALNTLTFGGASTGYVFDALIDLSAVGQIKFPAVQVPSANANTLDDYEEGTWTPVFSAGTAPTGVTYAANREGTYIKIGKLVFCDCRVTLTSKGTGGAGAVAISGMPFLSSLSLGGVDVIRYNNSGLAAGQSLGALVGSNSSSLFLFYTNGTGIADYLWATPANNLDLIISFVYKASA